MSTENDERGKLKGEVKCKGGCFRNLYGRLHREEGPERWG